jgi:hypothetical protein
VREILITDQPVHALFPYGRMLDDHTLLLHDAPGLSRGAVPKGFALGAMWEVEQLNIDAMTWGEIDERLGLLAAPIRDLPMGAVLETRMTIRPVFDDPAWIQARSGLRHERIASQMAHIRAGMPHHMGGTRFQSMAFRCYLGLRVPLPAPKRAVHLGRYDALVRELETRHTQHLLDFNERADILEKQVAIGGLKPVRLDQSGLLGLIAWSLDPECDTVPDVDPGLSLGANAVSVAPTLSRYGYAIPGWRASVYSLRKVGEKSYAGMLSASRLPTDLHRGPELWELAREHPITVVTQLTMAHQPAVKRRLSARRWVAGMFARGSSGQTVSDVEAVSDSLEELAHQLSMEQDIAVKMGVHVIAWQRESASATSQKALQYAFQRVGLTLLEENLEGNLLFILTLPLAKSLSCPSEWMLQRMRTMPLKSALRYLPILGSFRGYGNRHPGVKLLNHRGEIVHFDPIRDTTRPHAAIVGSNRSGKSAFMNWVINCLLPLGYTVFMMDRHGSYRALCDLWGGRHTRFERRDPVCVGPFDGDLSPEHQDALLVTMAEMCTRVSTAIPQASTTLTSRQGLILARMLSQWVERGEADSVPRLGQFVTYLKDHPPAGERQVCQELATYLSPYCLDGPYAAFIDGPSEIRLGEGLWSFDMAALTNTGQLSVVLTTSLLSAIDRFVTDPATLEIPIIVGMDEVSFDLKTPQAVEMIDRFTRAYARFRAGLWLLTQNMGDFKGDIGDIIRNNFGAFWTFRLNPEEASRFVDQMMPDVPHIKALIARLQPHEDCSEGFVYLPDGGSGGYRVVADPGFMTEIGQSDFHRSQRRERKHVD